MIFSKQENGKRLLMLIWYNIKDTTTDNTGTVVIKKPQLVPFKPDKLSNKGQKWQENTFTKFSEYIWPPPSKDDPSVVNSNGKIFSDIVYSSKHDFSRQYRDWQGTCKQITSLVKIPKVNLNMSYFTKHLEYIVHIYFLFTM